MVTGLCVMGKASFLPHVTYFLAIHSVVIQEVLDFIIPSGINEWILLHDLRQDFIKFVVMYETLITCVNGM